jgi:quinol monooxygenase YgiN
VNTVNILLRARPENRDEFLQTMNSLQSGLKQEAGFLKSSFFPDMSDINIFHLIEEWETNDSMERYLRSERFSVLMGALKVLCAESEVRYYISSGRLGMKIREV